VPANADRRLFAKGNVRLKTLLVEVAQSAVRVKGTYFRDKFWRLQTRRGRNRATMPIAHKILVRVYRVLAMDGDYRDSAAPISTDWTAAVSLMVWSVAGTHGLRVRLDQPAV
jgi:transposase